MSPDLSLRGCESYSLLCLLLRLLTTQGRTKRFLFQRERTSPWVTPLRTHNLCTHSGPVQRPEDVGLPSVRIETKRVDRGVVGRLL